MKTLPQINNIVTSLGNQNNNLPKRKTKTWISVKEIGSSDLYDNFAKRNKSAMQQ